MSGSARRSASAPPKPHEPRPGPAQANTGGSDAPVVTHTLDPRWSPARTWCPARRLPTPRRHRCAEHQTRRPNPSGRLSPGTAGMEVAQSSVTSSWVWYLSRATASSTGPRACRSADWERLMGVMPAPIVRLVRVCGLAALGPVRSLAEGRLNGRRGHVASAGDVVALGRPVGPRATISFVHSSRRWRRCDDIV
jgi:hypothetical protein